MINGEVYCASMREASRPGIVLVRRVRRARRSFREENGEGEGWGAAGLEMEEDMVTRWLRARRNEEAMLTRCCGRRVRRSR
jgi:hypothetical protein